MRFFRVALLIILPSAIFAQSNYHNGYALKNNGDTLKGVIDYREWGQNPTSIDFKQSKADNQSLKFDPKTIKGFQITGLETYESFTGNISMNKTRFPDLPTSPDTSKALAVIFLKQIATGSHITLFSHTDERKTRFFVAETNGMPVELKYFQYYENEKEVVEKNFYKGQLILYINKFSAGKASLLGDAERASYESTSLEKLVNDINDNKFDTTNGGNGGRTQSSIRLFAGAGGLYTRTRYKNTNFEVIGDYGANYYSVQSTSSSTSPMINFGLDMFINPNVQRLIFRTEVSVYSVNVKLYYPIPNQYPFVNDVLTFKQYTASLTPQLIFNIYNKDNFKVYIDGGVALNLSNYSNNRIKNSDNGANDPRILSYDLSNFWVGFPAQAGVVINKKIEVFLSYITYAKFSPHTTEFIDNQSTGLGIKYLFGKN